MTSREISLLLCSILEHELELPQGRIAIYNQNYKAPNDDDLYIIVGMQSARIIASTRGYKPDTDQDKPDSDRGVQNIVKATNYWIEFTSQGTQAMDRQGEVIAAIDSYYSQQVQAMNTIKISRTPDILDLSFIEGPSSLYRYRFNVIINNVETITKDVESFNKTKPSEVLV